MVFLALVKNAAAFALPLLFLSFPGGLVSSLLLLGLVLRLTLGSEAGLGTMEVTVVLPDARSGLSESELIPGVEMAASPSFSFFAWVDEPKTRFRKPPWDDLLPVVPASLRDGNLLYSQAPGGATLA